MEQLVASLIRARVFVRLRYGSANPAIVMQANARNTT